MFTLVLLVLSRYFVRGDGEGKYRKNPWTLVATGLPFFSHLCSMHGLRTHILYMYRGVRLKSIRGPKSFVNSKVNSPKHFRFEIERMGGTAWFESCRAAWTKDNEIRWQPIYES